ncbi:MAG: tetratricopeptide repeat protein [Rikenellaceae bacterium]
MRNIKVIMLLLCLLIWGASLADSHSPMRDGIELYNDGRWIDSRLSLLQAKNEITVDNSADNETLDFYLAQCAVKLDDPQAEAYLTQFERQYPASHYYNSIKLAQALLCCSEERYGEAKIHFGKVYYSPLSRKEREEYDMRVGYICFLEHDFETSRNHLNKINVKSDLYHHALYYLSYMDYIEGNNREARNGFSELLEREAYSSVAPFYLLQIGLNEGKYAEMLRDGEKLYSVAVPARQVELARSMAESAFRLAEYPKATGYIERYKSLGGVMGREESYIMGFSLYRQVRYSEAVIYLRNACAADDALTQNASYHLADCYLRSGDKRSASNSFAMAANEKYDAEIAEDALFNYAKLQYELGDDRFNETINTLSRYINKYPQSGERYQVAKELLIAAYYNSRNYDAAYQSIKELNNPDSDIRLALQRISLLRALESYNIMDYASAQSQLRESLAINISPKYSSVARFYLAEIDFIDGEYNSAIDGYNAYIASAPKNDENYSLSLFNIAYSKLMVDSDNEALGYFQRFIEATPSDTFYRADALNRVGDILYERRQFGDAKSSYQRATWSTYEPRHYALYQTAIIEGITRDYASKVKRLKSIIALSEGDYIEDAMYELGRSYIAVSDYNNGVKSHEQFIAEYPSSDKYAQALSDLGLAYLNLGDRSTSLKYYDKAISASPQSSIAKDALQGVREIYINDGRAEDYFTYASSVGHSGDLNSMTRDSLSFASAQKVYLTTEGRSQKAIESLSSYINGYPNGYYSVDALFYLSDSYIKCGEPDNALSTLVKLSQRGANQYSEKVYDQLSSLSYAEGQYSQAADAYLELHKISAKADIRNRALEGYVDATLKIGSSTKSLSMVDYVMSQSSVKDELLVKVKHAKSMILIDRGDLDSAYVILNELKDDPHSAEGAEATYILIESEFNAGNIDVAEQMIFAFAQSDTAQSYQLARAFLLLGDIYVLRSDYFQARATYQSIIDGYAVDGDNIIKQARTKIDKLP